jgi:hypothetical protein
MNEAMPDMPCISLVTKFPMFRCQGVDVHVFAGRRCAFMAAEAIGQWENICPQHLISCKHFGLSTFYRLLFSHLNSVVVQSGCAALVVS